MTETPLHDPALLVVAIGRPTFDVDLGAHEVAGAVELLQHTTDGPVLVLQPADRHTDDDDDRDPGDRDDHSTVFTDLAALDRALDRHAHGAARADVVVVLQATFSDSSLVGRIAERVDAPLLMWSFPEARTGGRLRLNSLCGVNLAAYLLRRPPHAGRPVAFLHLDPRLDDGTAGARAAGGIARALAPPRRPRPEPPSPPAHPGRCAAMFRGDRIGVVGDPPAGFEPCEGDPDALRELTGIEVERVPLSTWFQRSDDVDAMTRAATERRVRCTMDVPVDVEAAGMSESIALHGGLRALADEHGWTALTARCWPECMVDYGGAACTPMALLAENGLPAVCEADMFGAATGLLLQHVAGTDPFVADLVDADATDDTSVVWHCGVASAALARPDERITAITHPNRHRALANEFGLRPGRVTVARLSQAGGRPHLVIGGGEVLDRPRPFHGTCGVLRWDAPVDDVLDTVLDTGLEHHLGIVYGDHRSTLRTCADEWGLPVVWLTEAPAADAAST